MLAIRLQRVGRSGHAQFRVVVQDSRRTPKSGKIIALLGNFNPHAKTVNLDKERASFYLEHGAQPSDRVARLLKSENVKLPKWVKLAGHKSRPVKNIEKLRRNRPAEPAPTAEASSPTDETSEAVAAKSETPDSKSSAVPPTKTAAVSAEIASDSADVATP